MNISELNKKIVNTPNRRPFIIGIDGPSGAGKSTTCLQLARAFEHLNYRVKQIRFDDFWSASDDSRTGKFNPEKQVIGSDYRWQKLRDEILIPLREENPVHCVVNDKTVIPDPSCSVNAVIYDASLADLDIILVEGVFVVRDELRQYYDYSIYVNTPRKTSIERSITGVGEQMRHWYEYYWRLEEDLYIEKQQPQTKVDWLIDQSSNTDNQSQY